jgi:hypothetical protein
MKREHLGIVMLASHKTALEKLARANGEAMAVVLRRLIREEAERRGLWPDPTPQPSGEETRRV